MTLYVGEAVRIRSVITDPDTGDVLTPSTVTVSFWAPGRNPIKDASVRNSPDHGPYSLSFRSEDQDWVFYADTTGWAAGKWTYRVTVSMTSPTRVNWEYATVALKP